MTHCPACGAGRFLSKLLVFEETTFDDNGELTSRTHTVRTEFEFTCGECQTILRTLPADRREYYDDVDVLAADRQAALRAQLRTLYRQVRRRLWPPTPPVGIVLTVLLGIALLGL